MLKKTLCCTAALLLFSSPVLARDTVHDYSVKDALTQPKAKEILGNKIQFYFGKTSHGKVVKEFGHFQTNQKTSAFMKSDKTACQWVFLSAMKSLKERAEAEGGNAVINIKSNYRNNLTSSDDSFKCGAGAIIAGVALTGDVVTLK
ncbi:excinuclease ABC subunit A [Gallaecimonas mangrovi]|uniref:excinuclease ABC subunit A n=1 Tax=Gallaecimonas mangrovi TaxID=2291597 RepID=UPI000E1FB65B|nr:excinuclease ABC subunit A [Gallaecimonas mangrovi]